jgi:hypothetical protein
MLISRILDYIIVDDCIFKTRLKYYINNGYLSVTTDYAIRTSAIIEHIDITNKEFEDNIEIKKREYRQKTDRKKEGNAYYESHKEERKAYYEKTRAPDSNRMGSKEHSITLSCALRRISIEDFNGFADKRYTYILPIRNCIKMNEWFKGSHAHHITKSVIIYIPKELHRHISHNLKTGHNVGEINASSIQFINGGL